MGLKRTNYEVKDLDIILPEAYAIVKTLSVTRNNGYAEIVVQSSRENAETLKPIESVKIKFKVNPNENPFVTAYKEATKRSVMEVWDEVTGELTTVEKPAIFDGWQNDIV